MHSAHLSKRSRRLLPRKRVVQTFPNSPWTVEVSEKWCYMPKM
jgi:hypothetical protein